MSEEPIITINGHRLTSGQAMTVRVALSSFHQDISTNGLGDDAHGKRMTEAYLARLAEIFPLMYEREPKP